MYTVTVSFCLGGCLMVLLVTQGAGQLSTKDLWTSCDRTICGKPLLNIECDPSTTIIINSFTSGFGKAYDLRGYTNLKRGCLGRSSCDPVSFGFCRVHQKEGGFDVTYVCVKETDIDKTCEDRVDNIRKTNGFITSPNYPAQSQFRSCKWKIDVPDGHYVHIFLHEVSSDSDKCDGLIFMTDDTCGLPFPTFRVCDENKVNFTISACSSVEVMLGGSMSDQAIRFILSYYVIPVKEMRYASLYETDITCVINAKPKFEYSELYYKMINNTVHAEPASNVTNTTVAATSRDLVEDDDDYGLYVGLAAGVIIFLLIIVAITFYLRCRSVQHMPSDDSKFSLSNSNNGSEIQKRPLPERQDSTDVDKEMEPILQTSYSVVHDEVPRTDTQIKAPTYAEIEECNEPETNTKRKISAKKSVDNSKRELPAKPKEDIHNDIGVYADIDDGDAKDSKPEKTEAKNKKVADIIDADYYSYKKKLSNASYNHLYAECGDVSLKESLDNDKSYMDMTHKKFEDSKTKTPVIDTTVPQAKISKDKLNQTKRSQSHVGSHDKPTNQIVGRKTGDSVKPVGKSKNESVTSESDSDDDICMVENELYEPFESAKV